jgi:branched-subunit amino acid ABC-type transport system permease component
MATMLIWLLVAVALAFVIAAVTMWLIGRLARRRLPEAEEAAARTGADTLRVAPMVQSYGVASAGRGQLRGNGVLILTAQELRFDIWSPQRRLVIPLAAVLRVDTTRRHLGKHSAQPLLRVTWRDAEGLEDAAVHPDHGEGR